MLAKSLICFANLFSQFMVYLFIFVKASFEEQSFFILMKFNSLIFLYCWCILGHI